MLVDCCIVAAELSCSGDEMDPMPLHSLRKVEVDGFDHENATLKIAEHWSNGIKWMIVSMNFDLMPNAILD